MERARESFRFRRVMSRVVNTSRFRNTSRVRRRLAAAAVALFVVLATLLVYAKTTRTSRGAYGPADDCPRGALVYAQVADLPALLRLWDESKLKEKYLASTNFKQFQSGHVALKLAARLREFDDSLGFTLDAGMLADATDRKAAVAVYDIGRMELVFVAPVGEEKAEAARFFKDTDDFDKTELPDGTVYYGHDVEADRGRQKQKILFAFVKGRFVLATGEQLMLRTLANINGRSRADRLSDDPTFKTLSGEVSPHFAAVWVDQSKLNGDYYFKHYWAMGDAARLAGVRAGLFDFELREDRLLEHREFLIQGEARRSVAPPLQDLRELAASIPNEAAYARVRVLNARTETAASLIKETLLERLPAGEKRGDARGRARGDFDPSDENNDYSSGDYEYLGDDYDRAINDTPDDADDVGMGNASGVDAKAESELERVLAASRPSAVATAESPVAHDGLLFVEFRRSAVLALNNPDGLDRRALERAIESMVAGRLTVAGDAAGLAWADGGEGARRWRELELPMLGWKLCYELRGRQLFVSNDAAFINAALEGGGDALRRRPDAAHESEDLTLIRLDRRAQAFDRVFEKLDAGRVAARSQERGGSVDKNEEAASEEFFSGNVSSLLDVASPVSRVEIRRRSAPGRLYVEVEMVLDKPS
jgi:hypothetical protein